MSIAVVENYGEVVMVGLRLQQMSEWTSCPKQGHLTAANLIEKIFCRTLPLDAHKFEASTQFAC